MREDEPADYTFPMHSLQVLVCETASQIAERPTSTYTAHSTIGHEPRRRFTAFQLPPPAKPERPMSPQLSPPTTSSMNAIMCAIFIRKFDLENIEKRSCGSTTRLALSIRL